MFAVCSGPFPFTTIDDHVDHRVKLHQSDFVVSTVKHAFVLSTENGSQYSNITIIDDSENEFHADYMAFFRRGCSAFHALCTSLNVCDNIASNSIRRL